MAKTLKREAAESALRDEVDRRGRFQALRALPDDVDPALAADVVMELAGANVWSFGRSCRALPLPVIRVVVERMQSVSTPTSVFVREVARTGDDLQESWSLALETLLDFDSTYAWGSKQRKEKYARIAADSRLLAATQAVAVGCPEASTSMLAVLAVDGSDTSVDALMPHFVRAAETRDAGLDMLERLRTHAKDTPAVKAMLAQVQAMLGERKASSPALGVARVAVGEVDELWFSAYLRSSEDRLPIYQSNLEIDSRSNDWFHASVSGDERRVSFSAEKVHVDTLGVGACSAGDLPTWLARVAHQLQFTWDFQGMSVRTGLRGKKRERLLVWLASGGASG
ncbi:MAG: hypothetical protein ACXVEF_00510 [Polyangiales bacterium]